LSRMGRVATLYLRGGMYCLTEQQQKEKKTSLNLGLKGPKTEGKSKCVGKGNKAVGRA